MIYLKDEVWKDIEGYEGIYQVSNMGRVRSLDRIIQVSRQGERKIKGRVLRPNYTAMGEYPDNMYATVLLSVDGVARRFFIHQLVMHAFVSEIEGKPFVIHKNGINSDNRLENLQWSNTSEITLDHIANGVDTTVGLRQWGDSHGKSPVKMCDLNGDVLNMFSSITDAAKFLDSNNFKSKVCNICGAIKSGKTAYGYTWEYM